MHVRQLAEATLSMLVGGLNLITQGGMFGFTLIIRNFDPLQKRS